MAKCPNKNSSLYKRLSNQFSEDNIFRIWDAITTPEFDAWYGNNTRDKDGMPFINKYFQIQNDKGQVGNLLQDTVKLTSVTEVEKLLSAQKTEGISLYKGRYYVSKNKKMQGENMVKLLNRYYPGLLERTSYFTASQAIGVSDPSLPTTYLTINNVFTAQGRILYSPSRSTLLEAPESETGEMEYLINRLDEYKERVHDQLINAKEEAKQTKDYRKVESLTNKQDELELAIDELKIDQTVQNISKIANINLDYVEKLLEKKDTISITELNEINDILGFYEHLDSTEKSKHPVSFLTKSDFVKRNTVKIDAQGNETIEKDYPESTKKIQGIALTARNLREDYNVLIKEAVTKYYNETYEKNKTIEELFENIKDITASAKMTRDAASVNNSLLSLLHSVNNDASRVANAKTTQDQKEREEMLETLEKSSPSSLYKRLGRKKFMQMFWQKDDKGNNTGGLINEYSHKYKKVKGRLFNKMFYSDSVEEVKAAKEEFNATHEFVNYFLVENKDGTINEEATAIAKEKEFNRLAEIFDKDRVKEIIDEMHIEFKNFRTRREDAYAEIDSLEITNNAKIAKKERWYYRNHPTISINDIRDGNVRIDKFGNMIKFNSEFVRAIPLKINRGGEQTNFYDSAFEAIKKDATAYEYYKYVNGTIKKLLAFYPKSHLDAKGIHEGFIPTLKKSLLQQFMQDGMGLSLSKMHETARRWFSIKTYSKSYDHIDVSTGQVKDSLNIRMLSPNYKYVDGGEVIDTSDIVTDLDEILNQFIPVTNMYRYKSKLEATHNMILNSIDQMQGVQQTPTGVNLTGGLEGADIVDNLNHLKELARFLNEIYYEKQEKDVASKQKVLSKEEKKQKDNLEEKIDELKKKLIDERDTLTQEQQEGIRNSIEGIKRKLSDLGTNVSSTKSIKSILKYFQLVSQGWNLSSASIELVYGFASNNMHAAGGIEYTTKQISAAYKIAMAATMPGANTKTIRKFLSLIEKFDVIGEVAENERNSAHHSRKSKFSAKKALAPYEMMRRADMVSKGSVMIAMMMNTNLEGNPLQEGETSLWEAFNEDGEIKEDYAEHKETWEPIDANKSLRFATKIAQVNKRNHGNYDPNSQIMANSTALGKALLQFRRWMLEGFATRFEKQDYNDNLQRLVKGRYRTYGTLVTQLGGGNIVKGSVKTTSLMFKALLHNFAFRNMSDEQLKAAGVEGAEFSEADLENIRKNASGLKWLIIVFSALGMIKAALDDDEDNIGVVNFLLNQGGRLQQDLNFYANPSTMGDITKNIVPAFKLFDRASSWLEAMKNTVLDLDPEYSTVYERGDFKGSSKLLIKSGEMLPGTSTVIRTMRNAAKLYD